MKRFVIAYFFETLPNSVLAELVLAGNLVGPAHFVRQSASIVKLLDLFPPTHSLAPKTATLLRFNLNRDFWQTPKRFDGCRRTWSIYTN
jgi:hypothetical protein